MRSASDYGAHVRGLLVALVREGLLRRQTLPVELRSHPDGRSGNLFTSEPGLLYTDGAVLRIVAHAAGGATAYENAGGSVGDRPQQVIFRAVRNYRNEFEKTIADKLQADGVAAFAKSFETLLASVAAKQEKLLADKQALTASLEPTHR